MLHRECVRADARFDAGPGYRSCDWKMRPRPGRIGADRGRTATIPEIILETVLTTDRGRVRLINFMPPKTDFSKVVRIIEGIEGKVEMRTELVARSTRVLGKPSWRRIRPLD